MLKMLWNRGEISPEEQLLLLSTIFCYLMLDFYVKTGISFSLRNKRLFETTEVEITRVDCTYFFFNFADVSFLVCYLGHFNTFNITLANIGNLLKWLTKLSIHDITFFLSFFSG